jgi:hypothetical protein
MACEFERILKETFVVYTRHYPGISLEDLRKTMKTSD